MARKRIRWTRTDIGLYVPGDTDTIPDGALKRARGVDARPTGTWRSRNGSISLYILDAHSLFRFGDIHFQGVTTALYRNGISILTGLNGGRLTFARVPPTAGHVDYLFVAGGGLPRKVSSAGVVTQWGITKPVYNFTATKGTQLAKEVDDFDSAVSWAGANATLADEGTIKQEGSNAMSMTVAANTTGTATKSITVNLAEFASGPTASALQDYIEVWVRVEQPKNLESMQIRFSLASTNFAVETYSRVIKVEADIPPAQEISKQVTGVEEAVKIERQIETAQGTVIEDPVTHELVFLDQWQQTQALEDMGQTTVTETVGQWTKLRLPKATFQRSGDSADDWDDVQAVQLVVKTNTRGSCQVYWDLMQLAGSAGLLGRYRYHWTYRSSVTGTRSNSGDTYVEVANVERQPVSLNDIPISPDPQVDIKEGWRTVGGGTRFFKMAEIANATTSYTDRIPDFSWMDSTATTFLTSEELPLDNDPPGGGAWDVWGPHLGRVWHGREQTAGAKGRIYYSPIGRAEAVEDFLDVGTEDNPVVKGIIWNGQNYVFTESHLYKLVGIGPFTALEVFGVPGTTKPFTVKATPYGIVYEAFDGVRVFTGNHAALLQPNAVEVLFRGEAHENLTAFSGVIAEFANDEYFISDTLQTLVCHLGRASWRDLGKGCNALYYERDTGRLLATLANSTGPEVVELEAEGTFTETGGNVPFDLKTYAYQQDTPFIVERVTIDLNTNGTAPSLTTLLDATSISAVLTATSARDIRVQVPYRPCDRLAFQVTHAALTARLEVFNVEAVIRDFTLDVRTPTTGFQIPAQIISSTGITFEVGGADDPQQFDQLWLVRRVVLDHETNGQFVVPVLELDSATIPLPVYGDSRRTFVYDINRVGFLRSLQLYAPSGVNTLEVYRTWMELEPVQLVIRVYTNGQMQRVVVPGRFNANLTEVVFEIEATDPAMSRESLPLLRRLFIDFASNAPITPIIEQHGATTTLGSFAAPSRTLQSWEINRSGRLIKLRLAADWGQAIDLRAVELDVVLPEGI